MILTAGVEAPAISRDGLLADLEELWAGVDELLGARMASERSFRHGTVSCGRLADLPGHLAHFDRELVARAIARGPNVPQGERWVFQTLDDLDRWRETSFAHRPLREPWERSIERMHASRSVIRRLIGEMPDDGLARPVWWPLPLSGGWRTAGFALEACSSHTWNHLVELRWLARAESTSIGAIASQTHRALARYMRLMAGLMDRGRAARLSRLTAVMEFTGPGGGAWTFRIADGLCQVTEELPSSPDVVVTQSPDTFVQTMVLETRSQFLAVLTGAIKVRGPVRAVAAFRRLFPRPARDQVVRPVEVTFAA